MNIQSFLGISNILHTLEEQYNGNFEIGEETCSMKTGCANGRPFWQTVSHRNLFLYGVWMKLMLVQ